MRVVCSPEIERPLIEQTVKNLAEYCFKELTENQLRMYTEDLLDLGAEMVQAVACHYRRELDHPEFPLPGKLRKYTWYVDDAFLKKFKENQLS